MKDESSGGLLVDVVMPDHIREMITVDQDAGADCYGQSQGFTGAEPNADTDTR